MGTLALTTPDRDGTVVTAGAVAASDFIPKATLGKKGVILEIINGNASPDTCVISDATTTRSGAAAAANSTTVTNGTSKAYLITPQQSTDGEGGGVTITHTVTTTVTYKMYPRA